MSLSDRFRLLAQLNRSGGPTFATGGEIRGSASHDPDRVPAILSCGYAVVPGRSIGVDYDGPVVVQGDDWWPFTAEVVEDDLSPQTPTGEPGPDAARWSPDTEETPPP